MTKAPEAQVQLVARVMEAITHGWAPGLGTYVLAEYVGRKAEAEILALMKTRRRQSPGDN